MQPTSEKHNQILKSEFVTSEALFDNTTNFHSPNGVLHFDTYTGYTLVLFLLFLGELLSFRLLLRHTNGDATRVMPLKAGVLPKTDTRWEIQGFVFAYFLVVDMTLKSGT